MCIITNSGKSMGFIILFCVNIFDAKRYEINLDGVENFSEKL